MWVGLIGREREREREEKAEEQSKDGVTLSNSNP